MKHCFWDDLLSSEETDELCTQISNVLLEEISSEAERDVIRRNLGDRDHPSLCGIPVDYSKQSVGECAARRQIAAFWQKRRDFKLADTSAVAMSVFWDTERRCRETNSIFRSWASGGFQFPPDVDGVLHSASRKIARVLGDVPTLADLRLRFGPGATTNVKRRHASPRTKLSAALQCSENLIPRLQELLEEMPGWFVFSDEADSVLVDVQVVPARLDLVPKNAKTDRVICVEPVLNTLLQLGIGDHIALRLKRFGVDITDQTANQQAARSGSIDGELATLDLSSASDLLSTGLIQHLLPYDWFDFLNQSRSGLVEVENAEYRLEKFSTMGNGFTFPLETLIFWALASSCSPRETYVFGDDIIVATTSVPLLSRVLNACGLVLNKDKSHWHGNFRESCGADYLSGINIRPVYVKDRLKVADIFVLHNSFVRRGRYDLAKVCLDYLDPMVQLWGPDGYGDGHLISDDPPLAPHRRNDQWGGYIFESFTWKSRKSFKILPGDRFLPAYEIYARTGDTSFPVSLREYANAMISAIADSPACFYRKGHLGVTLPGTQGYKRVKIYTLSP